MRKLFRKSTAVGVVVLSAAVITAVATASRAASVQVCALLPDTKSSVRWEQFDKPALIAAFKAAHVTAQVVNALNDPQRQRSQADQCLSNGAKVIIETAIDPASAAAIEAAAKAHGAKSIDYDRLVTGGSGSVYVSFDGHAVGVLQGKGVVAGLKANGKYGKHPVVAELNGGSEDNNSFLFKGGYDSVLKPLYKNGTFKKGPDQFVPGWDNQKAGTIFEQMLVSTNSKIDAVAAANDGLANAVVVALQSHKLKPVPLSGQDATAQGVQNILAGWQTMTVYKAVPKEANAAAAAAVALLHGKKVATNGSVKDPTSKRTVPAVLIAPTSITKANYTILFRDKFLKRSEVCVGKYAKYCK